MLRLDAEMRVSDLKKEMGDSFAQVHARFAEVHARFAQVDARFARVDARFDEVDARFVQVDTQFADLKKEVDARFVEVREQIAAEGEATRRYFDVAAEQFKEEVRLLYDKMVAIDEVIAPNQQDHAIFRRALDDHEVRLKVLEGHRQ
jgi:hypothetical protein